MKVIVALFVCLLILIFGAYSVLPLVTEELIKQECSQTDPTQSCVTRMRAAGHIRSQRNDLVQAKTWYLRAAKHGDQIAMFHVAWVYEELALKKLFQSHQSREELEKGDALLESVKLQNAMVDRNIPLELKVGGDWAHARTWYRKSANLNFSPSMNNLARMYSLGLGGSKNPNQAHHWYVKAFKAGNPVSAINIGFTAHEIGSNIKFGTSEIWIPKSGENQDISVPTLERTRGLGFDISRSLRSRIRETAKKGEAVRIVDLLQKPTAPTSSYGGVRAMKRNPNLPTFNDSVQDLRDDE